MRTYYNRDLTYEKLKEKAPDPNRLDLQYIMNMQMGDQMGDFTWVRIGVSYALEEKIMGGPR